MTIKENTHTGASPQYACFSIQPGRMLHDIPASTSWDTLKKTHSTLVSTTVTKQMLTGTLKRNDTNSMNHLPK